MEYGTLETMKAPKINLIDTTKSKLFILKQLGKLNPPKTLMIE